MSSLYFGSLSSSSPTFIRPNAPSTSSYFYQAVRLSVDRQGSYAITCSSTLDTFGYLYVNRFDPNYVNINLVQNDDDGAGERQFALRAHLQPNTTYIVIATTYNGQETGSFSLKVSGPGLAQFSV